MTVKHLIHLLAAAMEAEPFVEFLPAQPGDVPQTWANISRAREVLGFNPTVPLEEGLRRFVVWFWSTQETGRLRGQRIEPLRVQPRQLSSAGG